MNDEEWLNRNIVKGKVSDLIRKETDVVVRDGSRIAFEAEARSRGWSTAKSPTGVYKDEEVEVGWAIWQAALKWGTW